MPTIVATGQKTLIDMNDITPSPTQPTNPTPYMLWMDTSSKPYKFYMYNPTTAKFEPTGYTSLEELDPGAAQEVDYAYNGVSDLSLDNRLTRFERSLVREELANMVGVFLAGTATMPTITQIDASGLGDLYSIRKQSQDVGLPLTDAAYVRLGNAYTALRTYLSATTVKAWDITSADTINIVSATWDAKWNEYYIAYNNLRVINNQRAQQYSDEKANQASKDAIAAVSNALEHERVPLTNPTTVNAPIAAIALPEFSGRHVDSWGLPGRNYLLGSDVGVSTTAYNMKVYNLAEPIAHGATVTVSIKGSLGPNKTSFGLYNSGGNVQVTNITSSHLGEDGVYRVTFPWKTSSGAVTAANTSLYVYHMPNTVTTSTSVIDWIKLEPGSTATPFSLAPEETFAEKGNRIKPITTPTFTSGTSITALVKAYGDGVDNDLIFWDTLGNLVKTKKWEDISLNGSENWVYSQDFVGFKAVTSPSISSSLPVHTTLQGVKNNGTMLSVVGTIAAADQALINATTGNLTVSVADNDSGWGESYVPTPEEIKAYFYGWKMSTGTFNAKYTGATADVKTWHPIGDTDLSRSTTDLPSEPSSTVKELKLNSYQMVYRLQDPVQEVVKFNGILNLIQGVNSVRVVYPTTTPEITSGTIKYATNLATATRDISYLIPTVQQRITDAEEIITDDSIVNRVMSSVDYKVAMTSKASLTDLDGLATEDDVGAVAKKVDDSVANALKLIDFNENDPFVRTTTLDQTSDGIKAMFHSTGGMNLIRNSIGYAGLDGWDSFTEFLVTTITSFELENIGFGSGFVFKPDGKNKGIAQTINCTPGQPYTLSWYLNKTTAGADSSYRFFIEIIENNVVVAQIADNSALVTDGYKSEYINHTPQTSRMTIRFVAYGNVAATLTGVMLTIGSMPLQWSLATGELYNTNIKLDLNGIRVSQINDKRVEVGFTLITPKEFAGYALVGKQYEKIFYLNGQQTVTKKLKAEIEISMGTVKALKINNGTNNGWAFIKNSVPQ